MYQLIIFDWDGTLMDSAQKIANCIKASARACGLSEPTNQQAKNIIGLGLSEAMEILFPKANDAQLIELVESYKYQFVTADDTEQTLFDGVEPGLRLLQDQGLELAIATGKSRAGLDRVFANSDLKKYFITTRCADETQNKPHPQMLNEILDFTSIDPAKAIMVGDTSYDLDMAKNAGIAGLGAGYGVHSHSVLRASDALYVANSFADLLEWLLDGKVEKAYGE